MMTVQDPMNHAMYLVNLDKSLSLRLTYVTGFLWGYSGEDENLEPPGQKADKMLIRNEQNCLALY